MRALVNEAVSRVGRLPAEAYCLPDSVTNALDTAKFWTGTVAVALAVIAAIVIGISMLWSHRQGDGAAIPKKAGMFIAGLAVISGATGLVSVFIQVDTNCIPR